MACPTRRNAPLLASLALALAACDPDDTPVGGRDAGRDAADAGPEDAEAGAPDVTPLDADPPDAGAEVRVDLGVAMRPDLGWLDRDVGPIDAGGACGSNLDCVPGEICGRVRAIDGGVTTHCRPPNPTPPASAIGGACQRDVECQMGVCLTSISQECSVVCSADEHCPLGFDCVGFKFNDVSWVGMCSRRCDRDLDCAPSGLDNVCSTQVYLREGGWRMARVCTVARGAGALGLACAEGSDCQSGICLTHRRGRCEVVGQCAADEACLCADDQAPPCAGGASAACVSRGCTALCVGDEDCASSAPGHRLTDCRIPEPISLPDDSTVEILACSRP